MLTILFKIHCWLLNMLNKEISYEYIRGLIEGEGCFSFSSPGRTGQRGGKIPSFTLSMTSRDKDLIWSVRDKLGLRNTVYEYKTKPREDLYDRQSKVILIVRDIGQLKNIIVPLCYKKLCGNKGVQFENWIREIGSDPKVSKGYKFIHHIYHSGFYDNIHNFD